jgi:hypothetical protein
MPTTTAVDRTDPLSVIQTRYVVLLNRPFVHLCPHRRRRRPEAATCHSTSAKGPEWNPDGPEAHLFGRIFQLWISAQCCICRCSPLPCS